MVRQISEKEMREWEEAANKVGLKEPISIIYGKKSGKHIKGEFVEKYLK